MTNHPFIPIIVGTDINAYTMSISFHEEYGIKPIIVGRGALPFTNLSNVIGEIEYYEQLGDENEFANVLIDVAKKYKTADKKLILIGTNDLFVRLIIENQEVLRQHFVFNYTSVDLMNKLQHKENFYKLCDDYGLDTPTTVIYDCSSDEVFNEEMMYPIILKPSNAVMYSQMHFAGKNKVFKVDTLEEARQAIQLLKDNGYTDRLVIQDFIPGDDTLMWDSVLYVNSNKKTKFVGLAQVVLQEHTPTAIGNLTAVVTRFDEDLMKKLQKFLEDLGYQGFANFDLKYDTRDGKFKLFEVNIRQGRSSYYVTKMGQNMARAFVDDLIYNNYEPTKYIYKPVLFTVVPKIVLKKFVFNKEINQEVRQLLKKGQFVNPLFYKADNHFKRKLFLFLRQINYYKKYKENQW